MTVDQQQLSVDTSAPLAIGGSSTQKLAQVVVPALTGPLVAVSLPVACSDQDVEVEIQGVTGGAPLDSCAIPQGPPGDTYPAGGAFFDALPNPPGWVPHPTDLPFQTGILGACCGITELSELADLVKQSSTAWGTKLLLLENLARARTALNNGRIGRAKRALTEFISLVIYASNLEPTNPRSIPEAEADGMIARASSLMVSLGS